MDKQTTEFIILIFIIITGISFMWTDLSRRADEIVKNQQKECICTTKE